MRGRESKQTLGSNISTFWATLLDRMKKRSTLLGLTMFHLKSNRQEKTPLTLKLWKVDVQVFLAQKLTSNWLHLVFQSFRKLSRLQQLPLQLLFSWKENRTVKNENRHIFLVPKKNFSNFSSMINDFQSKRPQNIARNQHKSGMKAIFLFMHPELLFHDWNWIICGIV